MIGALRAGGWWLAAVGLCAGVLGCDVVKRVDDFPEAEDGSADGGEGEAGPAGEGEAPDGTGCAGMEDADCCPADGGCGEGEGEAVVGEGEGEQAGAGEGEGEGEPAGEGEGEGEGEGVGEGEGEGEGPVIPVRDEHGCPAGFLPGRTVWLGDVQGLVGYDTLPLFEEGVVEAADVVEAWDTGVPWWLALSPDGQGAAAFVAHDNPEVSGAAHLFDLATGEGIGDGVPLVAAGVEPRFLAGAAFTLDGARFVVAFQEGGSSKVAAIDVGQRERIDLGADAPGLQNATIEGQVLGLAILDSGRILVGVDRPGELVEVLLDAEDARRLTPWTGLHDGESAHLLESGGGDSLFVAFGGELAWLDFSDLDDQGRPAARRRPAAGEGHREVTIQALAVSWADPGVVYALVRSVTGSDDRVAHELNLHAYDLDEAADSPALFTVGLDVVIDPAELGELRIALSEDGFLLFIITRDESAVEVIWTPDGTDRERIETEVRLRSVAVRRRAPVELCDAVDNDCDRSVDEDFGALGQACGRVGACAGQQGVLQCSGLFDALCVRDPDGDAPEDEAETCDERDNDCDGDTDEEVEGVGVDCDSDGLGACLPGTVLCAEGGGTACDSNEAPTAERCDGLDHDCDGTPDNRPDVLGQERKLSDGSGETERPAIVWTGAAWSIAVEHDPPGVGKPQVRFFQVGPDGVPLDVDQLVGNPDLANRRPDMAFNGVKHVVVWDENLGAPDRVRGAILDADGAVIREDVLMNTASRNALDAAIASNGEAFLIAWGGNGALRLSALVASGNPTYTEHEAGDGPATSRPRLLPREGGYAVVWIENANPQTVRFALVDAEGVVEGPVRTVSDGVAITPDFVQTPDGWAVVWSQMVGGLREARMALLDAEGRVVSRRTLTVDTGALQPALAWQADSFAVLYHSQVTRGIEGVRVSPDIQRQSEAALLAPDSKEAAAVEAGGELLGMVWLHEDVPRDPADAWFATGYLGCPP